jgi:hypothetical protein
MLQLAHRDLIHGSSCLRKKSARLPTTIELVENNSTHAPVSSPIRSVRMPNASGGRDTIHNASEPVARPPVRRPHEVGRSTSRPQSTHTNACARRCGCFAMRGAVEKKPKRNRLAARLQEKQTDIRAKFRDVQKSMLPGGRFPMMGNHVASWTNRRFNPGDFNRPQTT